MQHSAAILTVRGRVQGVGYRWWTLRTAQGLGLRGWVRNRLDGSVEILAIGPDAAIQALAEACGLGPEGAQVSSVRRANAQDDGSPGFDGRPTA